MIYQPTKWNNFKCFCFKGHAALMAAITVEGDLYIWGEGAQQYTRICTSIYAPNKVEVEGKVKDFALTSNFLVVVCVKGNLNLAISQKITLRRLG